MNRRWWLWRWRCSATAALLACTVVAAAWGQAATASPQRVPEAPDVPGLEEDEPEPAAPVRPPATETAGEQLTFSPPATPCERAKEAYDRVRKIEAEAAKWRSMANESDGDIRNRVDPSPDPDSPVAEAERPRIEEAVSRWREKAHELERELIPLYGELLEQLRACLGADFVTTCPPCRSELGDLAALFANRALFEAYLLTEQEREATTDDDRFDDEILEAKRRAAGERLRLAECERRLCPREGGIATNPDLLPLICEELWRRLASTRKYRELLEAEASKPRSFTVESSLEQEQKEAAERTEEIARLEAEEKRLIAELAACPPELATEEGGETDPEEEEEEVIVPREGAPAPEGEALPIPRQNPVEPSAKPDDDAGARREQPTTWPVEIGPRGVTVAQWPGWQEPAVPLLLSVRMLNPPDPFNPLDLSPLFSTAPAPPPGGGPGPIPPQADVAAQKTAPATAEPSGALRYRLSASNLGPALAAAVTLVDSLPAGVTFVGASPECNFGPGGVRCSVGDIPAGGSDQVFVDVRVDAATTGVVTNEVQASSDTLDPNPDNNTASAATTVTPAPPSIGSANLGITKTAARSVQAGQPLDYTVRVTNAGPDVATGVTVTDTFPPGVTFRSASPECNFSGGVVVCMGDILSRGDSDTFSIEVLVDASTSGSITNEAQVRGDQSDPNASNNTVRVTTTVTSAPSPADLIASPLVLDVVHRFGITECPQTIGFVSLSSGGGPLDFRLLGQIPASLRITPRNGTVPATLEVVFTCNDARDVDFQLRIEGRNPSGGTDVETVTIHVDVQQ